MSARHPAPALVAFACDLLLRAGLESDKAAAVAEVLVEGDLLGHTTHGLALLPAYLAEIESGKMARSGAPAVVSDFPVALTWDGRRLPGPWLVRRARPQAEPEGAGEATTLRAGDLLIDSARLEVRWQGTAITTTLTELRLLEILARGPGVVWTRDKLLDGLRGHDTHVAPRLIDTYVRRLRKKLEALDPGFDRIETVIGAGYRWRSEP